MDSLLRSVRGISTIALILLILVSGAVGAVLSYLWTVGYYVEHGLRIPEDTTTIAITNMTFRVENSTYFLVTVLNPTYSEGDADITSIALVGTAIGVKPVDSTEPTLPYPLRKGEDVTFRCVANWGELAGQEIEVAIFVEDGSGATSSLRTEFVTLEIQDVTYDTSITLQQLNLTIKNPSSIALDVSRILLGQEVVPQNRIMVDSQTITLPYQVLTDRSVVLVCNWTLWDSETGTGSLGTTKTVTIETLQGYEATFSETFSGPVVLSLSAVTFSSTNATQFTVTNSAQSPHGVTLSHVTVTVGSQTYTIAAGNTNATGYFLPRDSNITVTCEDPQLDWETWKDQETTIRVYATSGFLGKKTETVP